MKYLFLLVIGCLLALGTIAGAAQSVEPPESCDQCGMDRSVFNRSRMLVVFSDGTSVGVCSLFCATEEMEKAKGKTAASLKVADYATSALIDARTARWVIGGSVAGVMSSVPTWAFATEEAARKFIKANGGKLGTFDEAAKACREEESAGHGEPMEGHQHGGHGMGHGTAH